VHGAEVFVGTGSRRFDPQRPALALVHGAGMDHTVWVRVARHFARVGWAVLAPDLPAHGRSGGQALASIEEMARWLAALLDSVGVAQAALAGHSMGSLVALDLAAGQPARARALALLGTSLPMAVSDGLLAAARDGDHAAIDMANTWSHSPGSRLGSSADPGLWLMGCGERLLERADRAAYFADLTACNDYRRGLDPEFLAAIGCPALVIAGGADQMTPAAAGRAVADRLAGSGQVAAPAFVTLPGCGHSMLAERPNALLQALEEFLGAPLRGP
jgi:pimeloyl-ACP methyl ester carboxylesterase